MAHSVDLLMLQQTVKQHNDFEAAENYQFLKVTFLKMFLYIRAYSIHN